MSDHPSGHESASATLVPADHNTVPAPSHGGQGLAPSPSSTQHRLVVVNPLNLIIDHKPGPIDKTLQLMNVYPGRLAWKVQTNAPTRYVVSPSMGFLNRGETMQLNVVLVDGAKYHNRHQFVVHSKPAPGDETDRKTIWRESNYIGIQQYVRIKTLSQPKQTKTGAHPNQQSSLEDGHDQSKQNHGEHSSKIDELTEKVRKAVDRKQQEVCRLVAVVNEVKMLEVELDRETQAVHELSERIKTGESQYAMLSEREKDLQLKIDAARAGGGRMVVQLQHGGRKY